MSILSRLLGLFGRRTAPAAPSTPVPPPAQTPLALSDTDLALAAETGILEAYLLKVKGAGQNLRQLEGMDEDGDALPASGVTVDVPHEQAVDIAHRLQASAPPGWLAFVSDRHFGIGGAPDQVSVLRASTISDVLQVMGTNGWNYDISPDMVVARIQEWEKRHGLVLQGAGFDWFEASFTSQPPDMLAFANEVYEFCPDVVDQGTESVEALADEMARTNTVYLWWD